MKRLLIAVPVVVLTLLAVLIIAPSFIDWSVYKGKAQNQIKSATGYDVELNGKLSFAFIPSPRVHIENVVVKAPEGSSKPYLAKLERLKASVSLVPLFSGDVKISAVELIKPQIALEVLRGDKPNWVTPELEKISSAKEAVPQEAKKKAGNAAAQAISLDRLSIEQGQFIFTSAGKATEIESIDLDVKAETLRGPFEISGVMGLGGKALKFTATTGQMGEESESIALQIDADYNGIKLNYAGAAAMGEEPGLQGETNLVITSLAQAAKSFGAQDVPLSDEGARLSGLLSASVEKLEFKNASLVVGGHSFNADFATQLSPLYVSGKFDSKDTFNLDKIIPPKKVVNAGGVANLGSSKTSSDGAAGGLTKILPETLSIPVAFGADVEFSVPSLIYNNQVFNGVTLALSKKDKSFQGQFSADQIPGKGKIEASADLTFAEKSISKKTGAQIYSGASMAFNVKANTPDLPFTLQAVTGEPAPLTFKTVEIDAQGYLKPGTIEVNDTKIVLDGKPYSVSGALAGEKLLVNALAAGGKVIVKGDVTSDMKLQNAAVQVTHPNLAQAIRTLSGSPASAQNAMLAQKIDFYTNVNQEGDVYKLTGIKATLGQSSVSGALTYDSGSSKPNISGVLGFGDLILRSTPASSSGGGSDGSSGKIAGGAKTSGRWSKAPIETSWMDAANIDFAIDAKSIKYETWDLTKPKLQFTLNNGVLDIKDLSSGLYGGSVALSGSAKRGPSGALSVEGQTKMSGIQMEPLVKALTNNKIVKGKGSINSETRLNANGASHAALINSLGGQGAVTGSDIVLEGIDLNRFARALSDEAKPGDSLMNLWKGATNGGSTAFAALDGAFTIQEGIVDLAKLDLDGPRGAIQTKGTVDLPAWTIETAHRMVVKDREDVPPFTIKISGSLDNPGQTFAQGAINDYLQRKLSRKLEKVLTEELSDKIGGDFGNVLQGVLGGGNTQAPANDNMPQQSEPASGQGSSEAQPVQQQQKPQQPEEILNDAFQGLIQGLGR